MAASNIINVKMEVDQAKIDRLVAAEDRFRAAAKEMQDALQEVRDATRELGDPFILVKTEQG